VLQTIRARRLVLPGDWDERSEAWQGDVSVRARCQRGLPWDATDEYREYLEDLLERGLRVDDAHARARKRFAQLELLLQEMAAGRYVCQRSRGRWLSQHVAILLGRDGSPIMSLHGNHRMSIAKCLGIRRMPVVVKGIHDELFRDWLAAFDGSFASRVESGLRSLGLEACSSRRRRMFA
jgi:hypothetical protein